MWKPHIFREYDIRGVVDTDFNADFAKLLGRAYAQKLRKTFPDQKQLQVSVGCDARVSSPSLKKAVAEGLTSSGVNVLDLGLVTTPISYYSTFAVPGLNGAIMITGSHNPPDYNGFKISVGQKTIFGDDILSLRTLIQENAFIEGQGKFETFDIFPTYLARYEKEFAHLKQVPLVLDCGNGAAGCIVKKLFEVCGQKPLILFEKPDGQFPNHHPDPTVEENLVDLKKAVKETKALVGIGFDGDADRIGLIDENGRMILGDELMVLLSRSILLTNPGQTIIGDVKCSDRLFADIEKNGGKPLMWKTGHSLIKQKIREEKSPFGGEMSGHIFFADRNYGYDDALYAALRVVEILSQTGKTISELLSTLPPAHNTPELRIDTTEEKKVSIVAHLRKVYGSRKDLRLNLIDGIRISFPDGWALARASNTQPVLVLRFESSSAAGLKRIQSEVEKEIQPLL